MRTAGPGEQASTGKNQPGSAWSLRIVSCMMMLQALGISPFTACHTVGLSLVAVCVWYSQLSSWDSHLLSVGFPLYTPVGSFLSCIPFSFGEVKPTWLAAGAGFLPLPWQLNSLEAIACSWTLFASAEGAVSGFSPTPKNGAGLALRAPTFVSGSWNESAAGGTDTSKPMG